jgi:8-oxo-dGTP pyrophosphatase MutT (NUDIX family)
MAILLAMYDANEVTKTGPVFDGWGQGEAKDIKDLLVEIQTGESQLVIDSSGIRRVLKIVRMEIVDPTFGTLLHERTVLGDGRVRILHRRPSGKINSTETPVHALCREIREELGLEIGDFNGQADKVITEVASSKSFPGLRCEYEIHPFTILPCREWLTANINGLVRQDGDQVLHFIWCKNFVPTPK